ncbi:MAG: hypothetical protein ACKOX6_12105 [Bdellovibrio sp.]
MRKTKRSTKVAIYFAAILVLTIAKNAMASETITPSMREAAIRMLASSFPKGALFISTAHASDFLKCHDKTLKNCEEISKGQAVREQVKDPKSIIIKVDQVELSEKGTLKAKSN